MSCPEADILNLGCDWNRTGYPNSHREVTSSTLRRDRTTSTPVYDCTLRQCDPVCYFLNLNLYNHAIMPRRHVSILAIFEHVFDRCTKTLNELVMQFVSEFHLCVCV